MQWVHNLNEITEATIIEEDDFHIGLLNYRLSQKLKLLRYDKFNHLTTHF